MVLILDGSSEHAAHVRCKIDIFREKKFEFDDSFEITKSLQQIVTGYLRIVK